MNAFISFLTCSVLAIENYCFQFLTLYALRIGNHLNNKIHPPSFIDLNLSSHIVLILYLQVPLFLTSLTVQELSICEFDWKQKKSVKSP